MPSVRELLLDVDMQLEDYTAAISSARNPSLSDADRIKLIRAGEASWRRLEAAHRQLERQTSALTLRPVAMSA